MQEQNIPLTIPTPPVPVGDPAQKALRARPLSDCLYSAKFAATELSRKICTASTRAGIDTSYKLAVALSSPQTEAFKMPRPKVCLQCGAVGPAVRCRKGSLSTELFLWCFFIVPGLLYSVWRHASVYYGCSECGAKNVIPINSPVATKFFADAEDASAPCPKCGKSVRARWQICRNCGMELTSEGVKYVPRSMFVMDRRI